MGLPFRCPALGRAKAEQELVHRRFEEPVQVAWGEPPHAKMHVKKSLM
jgi:hypothetical protein